MTIKQALINYQHRPWLRLVLVSESMADRQWSYVALSRHRKELRVFVTAEQAESLPVQLDC